MPKYCTQTLEFSLILLWIHKMCGTCEQVRFSNIHFCFLPSVLLGCFRKNWVLGLSLTMPYFYNPNLAPFLRTAPFAQCTWFSLGFASTAHRAGSTKLSTMPVTSSDMQVWKPSACPTRLLICRTLYFSQLGLEGFSFDDSELCNRGGKHMWLWTAQCSKSLKCPERRLDFHSPQKFMRCFSSVDVTT